MIGQISKLSSAIISLALAGCIKPSASTLDLHQSIEEQTHETWKELTDKNFENLYKFNGNNKLALLITENGIDQNYLQIAKDISGKASLLYLSKNNQAAKEKYKLFPRGNVGYLSSSRVENFRKKKGTQAHL